MPDRELPLDPSALVGEPLIVLPRPGWRRRWRMFKCRHFWCAHWANCGDVSGGWGIRIRTCVHCEMPQVGLEFSNSVTGAEREHG